MFWMRAYPVQGQVGGDWALGFEKFFGPKKLRNFSAQSSPTCPSNGDARIQNIMPRAV